MNLIYLKKLGRYGPPYETPSLPVISAPRKSPTRNIKEDQYQEFLASDTIKYLDSLNVAHFQPGYLFSRHKVCVVCYKISLSVH